MDETLSANPRSAAHEVLEAASARPTVAAPRKLPPGFPPEAVALHMLGVDYSHLKTPDGGDLYLTQFGRVFWRYLQPENWYARDWFTAHRQRLHGTSTVYRVPTRPVAGRSINLVVKFSRVGEEIPMDTFTINKFVNAEFNSPFEEFSFLMELREGRMGPQSIQIKTQHPLAIYVPSRRLQLWQTGRSEAKIKAKITKHSGVEIDILRQYVVVFGWIKGLDAAQTADHLGLKGEARSRFLAQTNSLVVHELAQKGYQVADMKPEHVILRPQPDGSLLRDRNGQFVYGLVDYELLHRTPEHEQAVRTATRQFYLKHMARRFEAGARKPVPSHLKAVKILGVDYIFGHAESTGGLLWVVGRDPDLVNFFLPERWRRTKKTALSDNGQVYYTRTKDDINLVWRVSRMGDTASAHTGKSRREAIREHGYNSPFEEFALAMELSRAGARVVYPRAIYMTGSLRDAGRAFKDDRRFNTLNQMLTPEGEPLLRRDRDYITVWGFWNGPDEMLAADDTRRYRALNAGEAREQGLIDNPTLQSLLQLKLERLRQCGIEDLNPKPDHLLVSFDHAGTLVRDAEGKPDIRLCNFELLRKLA
ncbi:MAG: hypothetical protein MUE94_11275 [Verrucomicrobia bacterium]|jgi:hypothetical protein|nr:hypothetical protein [Verrucomicrobiota bacterium]